MRIHEDGIYHPPDMIEKTGGLQIKGSGIRNGRSCSFQTTLHHPIVEAAEPEDSEYGDVGYCRVATYTSVVAIAAGHIEELRYPVHIGELWYPESAILKIRENTARVL